MDNDPRGPIRKIVAVERATSATRVTLNCEHVARANQIYTYRVGGEYRCFACGQGAPTAQEG